MTTKNLLAACAAATFVAGSATAQLAIYEPFDYSPTAPHNDGGVDGGILFLGDGNQAGGLGLGTWTQVNTGANEIDVAEIGLTFTDAGSNVLPVAGMSWERASRVGQAASSSPIDASATTALTADNTTIWMSFLFQDRGFSGPDFGIGLNSENMVGNDNQDLDTPGFGVGFSIVSSGGPARNIGTAVYGGDPLVGATAAATRVQEATPTFDGPTGSDVHLLAMKVNWNEFGTLDEIFVFDITDITTEPTEGSALAADTFDFDLATQQSLDVFNISDTQVSYVDEVRVGATFADVMGGASNPFDPADLDQDGDVDDADFGIAFAAFTGPGGGPSSNPAADLDGDGDVDDADFGIAFAAFTGPGGAAVPEPASLALLGLGGLLIARRRRA